MGGSSGKVGGKQRGGGAAGSSGGGGGAGGGSGSGGGGGAGGGGGGDDGCPDTVRARLAVPSTPALHVGEAVAARLGGTSPETVIVVHSASETTIGTLAGIPDLAQLIRCLRDGVGYAGSIDQMVSGAFGIVLWRS